ncbi:ion channel [Vannielia litorea]|uniref:ion channel n=1 Tax=Vannielia litorea TaxID=1217970 RepID=UPI001C93EDDB|nr:ion channel [Vannielia litorea]MBY6048124.1 two pore domain potassium channel family protein [Vannielia litorea]MBY6075538.1 two pore domain potassium channel family protein [Vannielia litorea]
MLIQLLLGSAIMAATTVVAALSLWGLEAFLARIHGWVIRPPQGPRLVAAVVAVMLWTLVVMTAAVWIWALALWALGVFVTLEASVYFALVAFTTLGFGDILLPLEWRLLGGLAAANGLLVFALLAAMLVETLRQTRLRQRGDRG